MNTIKHGIYFRPFLITPPKLAILREYQGIVGCTPTNVPLWEIPKKAITWWEFIVFFKSPRIPKKTPAKYHGAHTVRGTPNCIENKHYKP